MRVQQYVSVNDTKRSLKAVSSVTLRPEDTHVEKMMKKYQLKMLKESPNWGKIVASYIALVFHPKDEAIMVKCIKCMVKCKDTIVSTGTQIHTLLTRKSKLKSSALHR